MVTLLGLCLRPHLSPPFPFDFFYGPFFFGSDEERLFIASGEREEEKLTSKTPTLHDAHHARSGGSKTYLFLFLRLLCNLAQRKKLEDAPWSKMELGAPSRAHTAHGDEGKRGADKAFFSFLLLRRTSALTLSSLVLSLWVEETSKRQRSIAAGEPA